MVGALSGEGHGQFPEVPSFALYGEPDPAGEKNTKPPRLAASSHANVVYCGRPSMVNARNFAYLSPILRASLYSAELRQAWIFSILSQTCTATRSFGGWPSIDVTFCPAARRRPPAFLIDAWASGAYSFV